MRLTTLFFHVLCCGLSLITVFSCSAKPIEARSAENTAADTSVDPFMDRIRVAVREARLAEDAESRLLGMVNDSVSRLRFEKAAAAVRSGDPYLYVLVDKKHSLSADYVPADLVELDDVAKDYLLNKSGMKLRAEAEKALAAMAAAARADGVTLIAASTYRSYKYQEDLYERNVRELGREAADRESARAGTSQHQLGTALDFYPISDKFAETKACQWLIVNASRFGWSLSYPNGYEALTGYRWESWHYRYIGKAVALFIEEYFGGIQQYGLAFLDAWSV